MLNFPCYDMNDVDSIINNVNVVLSFDLNGNVYFTYNANVYQINIDNKNNLICDKAEYEILDNVTKSIQYYKLYHDDSNKDSKEEHYNYYPEDREYINSFNDECDNSTQDGSEEKMFFSFTDKKIIEIDDRENGEFVALYETLLYDSDNKILLKTTSNEALYYRLILNTNGLIIFRPTGEKEQRYKLVVDNNDIKLQILK